MTRRLYLQLLLPDTQETLKRETDDVLGHLLAGARQLAGQWAILPQVGHVHGVWARCQVHGDCAVTGPGLIACHRRMGRRRCNTGPKVCSSFELHVLLCYAASSCDVSLICMYLFISHVLSSGAGQHRLGVRQDGPT